MQPIGEKFDSKGCIAAIVPRRQNGKKEKRET